LAPVAGGSRATGSHIGSPFPLSGSAACALKLESDLKMAEGEGFEPPRAWRPLRFSSAPIDVLSGVATCRPDYESRLGCGSSVPPGTSPCRRGGGMGGGTRRAQTGEPTHVTTSSKARRPCHYLSAAQMAEERQISRHAHAVDELGTHRSAPAISASPMRGCANDARRATSFCPAYVNTPAQSRSPPARCRPYPAPPEVSSSRTVRWWSPPGCRSRASRSWECSTKHHREGRTNQPPRWGKSLRRCP